MEKYGADLNILSAWGYDALYVYAKAVEKCGDESASCVSKSLVGMNFEGATGYNVFTS